MSRRLAIGLVSGLALTAALSLSLAACAQKPADPASDMPPLPASATAPVTYVHDIHSYAQPQVARVKHVGLNLTADFAAKTLSGTATLDITGAVGATQVVLDTKNLDIKAVRDAKGPLAFVLGAADPILGQSLTVTLPALAAGETHQIIIDYSPWLNR